MGKKKRRMTDRANKSFCILLKNGMEIRHLQNRGHSLGSIELTPHHFFVKPNNGRAFLWNVFYYSIAFLILAAKHNQRAVIKVLLKKSTENYRFNVYINSQTLYICYSFSKRSFKESSL